jgi:four helix bundle protein
VQFCPVVSRLRVTPPSLRDQIDGAAASVVLTLADGIGRVSAPDRAHFFAMARGSALECAAALDVLAARGTLSASVHREARALLVRMVQMLTRLIDRQRHPRVAAADGGRALHAKA